MRQIQSIHVATISVSKMRYATCGDYWQDKHGALQVRIAKMKNPLHWWLILIHELVEIALCFFSNVRFADIDDFDVKFEKDREARLHTKDEEPGDDPSAPYHIQHCFATAVERMLCAAFRLSWKEYDDAVLNLNYNSSDKNTVE